MADIHFKEYGWAIFPILDQKEADEIAEWIRIETLWCLFHSIWDRIEEIHQSDINPTTLIVDSKLRKQLLEDPNIVWRNGNSRTPVVSANFGGSNIYHQPLVRDKILFNPKVIESIRSLYRTMPESTKDEKLVYMAGPERVGLKAPGATDMDRHLDPDMLKMTTGKQHHHYRVQGVMTLRIDEATSTSTERKRNHLTSTDLGSLEVLQNFHHYSKLAFWFFRQNNLDMPTGIGIFKFEDCNKQLPKFIQWLKAYYSGEMEVDDNTELVSLLQDIPETYKEIVWIAPKVTAGQLICFDSRLPHRNNRNKTDVDRIVAYVSLFRQTDWIATGKNPILPMFLGDKSSKTSGRNIRNPEEREVFESCWEERVRFSTKPKHVKEVLGI